VFRYVLHARRRSVAILVLQGNSFRNKRERERERDRERDREREREKLEVIEKFQHFPLRRRNVLCEPYVYWTVRHCNS